MVAELEVLARESPRLYLLRVAGLVLLAYGYLGFVLLGSIALTGSLLLLAALHPNAATLKVALFIAIASGALAWAIIRGLWVRLDPPAGTPLTREDSPRLFALLDELQKALGCLPFHRVLLVSDMNAAVVQIPRLGIFGWHRNYLLLGLPLMQCLQPDEFKAVLAHEFAHSSRGHGRFSNWLYRIRQTWGRIFAQMTQQDHKGAVVLTKFVDWYWPRFNAHAFVLARANEYDADACAVQLAGVEATAHSLLKLPVYGSLTEKHFWPRLLLQTNLKATPPSDAFMALRNSLRTGPTAEDGQRWLRQAFLAETDISDTHPCLKDRLRAIGHLPPDPIGTYPIELFQPSSCAMDHYLGAFAAQATQLMSTAWRESITTYWSERHARARTLAQELVQMDERKDLPPTVSELWHKACNLMELRGASAVEPVLNQVLRLEPNHAGANYLLGRNLLEQDNVQGVAFVEAAIKVEPTITTDALGLVHAYYARTGQRGKMDVLLERLDRHAALMDRAQKERLEISKSDEFLPHDLPDWHIENLRTAIASETDIALAAVVQKRVHYLPERPAYALAVWVQAPWWRLRIISNHQALVKRLARKVEIPGECVIFTAHGKYKKIGRRVRAVANAMIYIRNPSSRTR